MGADTKTWHDTESTSKFDKQRVSREIKVGANKLWEITGFISTELDNNMDR